MRSRYLLAALCFALFFIMVGLGTGQVGLFGLDGSEATPQQTDNAGGLGQLPPLQLTTMAGEQLSTSDLAGKVVIINFWASWCAPCIREFPLLLDTVLEQDNAGATEVLLLAISNDQHNDEMLEFLQRFPRAQANPEQVKLIWDPRREISRNKFNVVYLPETFIVKDNNIISKIVGEINEEPGADELAIITQLLQQ